MSDVGLFLLMFAALIGCLGLIRLFAWFTDIREAGGPIAYARQASGRYVVNTSQQPALIVMSRAEDTTAVKADMDAVSIPVEHTGMSGGMGWEMPRVSAYLDDNQTVIMLARLKLRDGKYRFSANKIAEAVGGDRNKVLDVIRQVRQAPEYALTPDQETARRELGLSMQ